MCVRNQAVSSSSPFNAIQQASLRMKCEQTPGPYGALGPVPEVNALASSHTGATSVKPPTKRMAPAAPSPWLRYIRQV